MNLFSAVAFRSGVNGRPNLSEKLVQSPFVVVCTVANRVSGNEEGIKEVKKRRSKSYHSLLKFLQP